jgi:hypothetical protein
MSVRDSLQPHPGVEKRCLSGLAEVLVAAFGLGSTHNSDRPISVAVVKYGAAKASKTRKDQQEPVRGTQIIH